MRALPPKLDRKRCRVHHVSRAQCTAIRGEVDPWAAQGALTPAQWPPLSRLVDGPAADAGAVVVVLSGLTSACGHAGVAKGEPHFRPVEFPRKRLMHGSRVMFNSL